MKGLNFVIKQVDRSQITTVKSLRSWDFERQPFVVTFPLDYEANVSIVILSSSFFD